MRKWIRAVLTLAMLFVGGNVQGQSLEDIQVLPPQGATGFSVSPIEEGKVLVTATDAAGNPLRGLTPEDFRISTKAGRKAEIVSVEPLETNKDVSLDIILVADNSASMEQRKAVEPLLTALDEVFKLVRPIDRVHLIVFDDRETLRVGSRDLYVRTFRSSSPVELKNFLTQAFRRRLTNKTVLYEAMLAGVDIARRMPADATKFLVVFTDGQDINSAFKSDIVRQAAAGLKNFEAYAVDYMPGDELDPFLQSFAAGSGGRIWKANAAIDLVPIFQAVSSKMLYRYVVTYRFPPAGSLAVEPLTLTIEEITTIDSSPMLGHVYFDTGSSDIPARYVRLNGRTETEGFSEQKLRGSLEKYHNLLNVIGRRMNDHPEAAITLVGCNANTGAERGNTALSRLRAEAVKAYLQYVWGIAPDRMAVEARNLPEAPSTSRIEAGRADNQRVEIRSDAAALLDVIESTYVEARMNTRALTVRPVVDSAYGIARWEIRAAGGDEVIGRLEGESPLESVYALPLKVDDPEKLAAAGRISVTMEVTDRKQQQLQLSAAPVEFRYIQKKELMAKNLGYKVQEKYALILFDFDSAQIKDRNQVIVDRIAARIRDLPDASVEIVGHTDNIGKDDYNMKLSERRAKAVYDQLIAAYGRDAGDRIRFLGQGPFSPLYENDMPENRAFNRTVTITLEYQAGK